MSEVISVKSEGEAQRSGEPGPGRKENKASLAPAFLITIDTEGDNLWARPKIIGTRNAAYAARFQDLCEQFSFKPTWLTNHEMATSPVFAEFGRSVLRRGTGEIGMHLHAWNSPPIAPLTDDDYFHQPFLTEYPADVVEEKVSTMTDLLRDRFETQIVSHRAGRWSLNSTYAKLLAKYGYLTDCSVTPYVSWVGTLDFPSGNREPDYRRFPTRPYFIDLDHIDRQGTSPLLELPVSILPSTLYRIAPWAYSLPIVRRFAWRHQPKHSWLYPNGANLPQMMEIVDEAIASSKPYIELVIHSSELMPSGSFTFRDEESIECLYKDLTQLFRKVSTSFRGSTLNEFRTSWIERH